jgi:hypothetical protein
MLAPRSGPAVRVNDGRHKAVLYNRSGRFVRQFWILLGPPGTIAVTLLANGIRYEPTGRPAPRTIIYQEA